jgi:serine/threonine protein kinase
VKVLLNGKASRDERARFQREVELTPLVKHRNVITLIDSGTTHDELTYLVVPALAGKELRAYIEASPNGLAPEVVVRVFSQLLMGLQAIHDAGIVHRDLKPENVFVLAGGQYDVKVMDLGLAKRAKESGEDVFRTVAGEIVGSPAYIAPETVQCDPADARTDLYSVGIMLFECLTGKRPIDSLTSVGYLTAHMVAPPLTLIEAIPDRPWPAAAEKLVARLLEKSRDERPQSAAEALKELEAVAPSLVAMGLPPGAQPADAALTKKMLSMTLLGRLQGSGAI